MILWGSKVSSEHFVVDVGMEGNHHRNAPKVICLRQAGEKSHSGKGIMRGACYKVVRCRVKGMEVPCKVKTASMDDKTKAMIDKFKAVKNN